MGRGLVVGASAKSEDKDIAFGAAFVGIHLWNRLLDCRPESGFLFLTENAGSGWKSLASHLYLDVGICLDIVPPARVSLLAHGTGDDEVVVALLMKGKLHVSGLARFSADSRECQHRQGGNAGRGKAPSGCTEEDGVDFGGEVADDPGSGPRCRKGVDQFRVHKRGLSMECGGSLV